MLACTLIAVDKVDSGRGHTLGTVVHCTSLKFIRRRRIHLCWDNKTSSNLLIETFFNFALRIASRGGVKI